MVEGCNGFSSFKLGSYLVVPAVPLRCFVVVDADLLDRGDIEFILLDAVEKFIIFVGVGADGKLIHLAAGSSKHILSFQVNEVAAVGFRGVVVGSWNRGVVIIITNVIIICTSVVVLLKGSS